MVTFQTFKDVFFSMLHMHLRGSSLEKTENQLPSKCVCSPHDGRMSTHENQKPKKNNSKPGCSAFQMLVQNFFRSNSIYSIIRHDPKVTAAKYLW